MTVRDQHELDERQLHEVDLPQLPEGVRVPDDLRDLEHVDIPSTHRGRTGVRWLRWMAPLAVLAFGVVGIVLVVIGQNDTETDGTVVQTPAYEQVQQAIDQALLERRLEEWTPVTADGFERYQDSAVVAPAYEQVQQAIDQALLERRLEEWTPVTADGFERYQDSAVVAPAYEQVQQAIDEALAER
jgi:hypothetical protein